MSHLHHFTRRFRLLVEAYGMTAVVIYFGMWIPLVIGFYFAVSAGLDVQGWDWVHKAPSWLPEWLLNAPELVAAIVFAKLIKPLLLTLTFILTPMLAKRVTGLAGGMMVPAAAPEEKV